MTMRVLFVDDQQSSLDALRRVLRPLAWETAFVRSGPSALALLEGEPFDVIVTDMQMPGMDGAALLHVVQQRHPEIVRIVLSGYADAATAMRSVSVSHQCLSKPCQVDVLELVVERASNLVSYLADPALRTRVASLSELPVPSTTYRRLTTTLADPSATVQTIAGIVTRDPSVSAKLLQIVNSSFFGLRREITSVPQAVSYLGVNTLRDLVLSFDVFRVLDRQVDGQRSGVDQERYHSLATARLARDLLPAGTDSECAFTAGLLHDVGQLVLAMTSDLRADDGPAATVSDHGAVGAYLLGLWGIPYTIVEAVAYHHRPSRVAGSTSFDVLGAVHVADCLISELDASHDSESPTLDVEYLRRTNVERHLDAWRRKAQALLATVS